MNAFFSEQIAADFAAKWIAAWNARDLDRILKHYAFEEKNGTSSSLVLRTWELYYAFR